MDDHRKDIDDRGWLLAHDRLLGEPLHREERAARVGVHEARPDVGRRVEKATPVAGRGGVHEGVGAAHERCRRVHEAKAVLDAGKVRLHEARVRPCGGEPVHGGSALRLVAAGEDDAGAAFRDEPLGDGEAEALCATGDDGACPGVAGGEGVEHQTFFVRFFWR